MNEDEKIVLGALLSTLTIFSIYTFILIFY